MRPKVNPHAGGPFYRAVAVANGAADTGVYDAPVLSVANREIIDKARKLQAHPQLNISEMSKCIPSRKT
jgi:hypothetical protein